MGFVYLGIAAILIYTLGVNAYRVYGQQMQYNELVEKRDTLLKEKEELTEQVELLNDDDYVARYARDNYIFSKDGEEVVKLPDSKK
jgi:cell division protein DivIC